VLICERYQQWRFSVWKIEWDIIIPHREWSFATKCPKNVTWLAKKFTKCNFCVTGVSQNCGPKRNGKEFIWSFPIWVLDCDPLYCINRELDYHASKNGWNDYVCSINSPLPQLGMMIMHVALLITRVISMALTNERSWLCFRGTEECQWIIGMKWTSQANQNTFVQGWLFKRKFW
jgi:hypothetical protein